jgi:hypothetical protein
MKIIGHTHNGYLVEITPQEIASITGKPDDDAHQKNGAYGYTRTTNHSIGAVFHVNPAWKHLQKINESAAARASIAERLRAAATLVEHTPVVMELPDPGPEPASDQATS